MRREPVVTADELPAKRIPWPLWRWGIVGLSLVAFLLAAFLSWQSLTGGTVIGCGGGSGCDQVLTSRWASVAGVVPVSGIAAGAYLAILLASFFLGPKIAAPDRRLAWGALLLLAGATVGSAVWFNFLQIQILHAFCPYCLATHITGTLLACLIFFQALRQPVSTTGESPNRLLKIPHVIGIASLGLLLAGALAGAQYALTPRVVYRGGETQEKPDEKPPSIDPRNAPLVGSPDATHIIQLFFDYRCPHCQQVHGMLEEVIRRYDGKVAFVLCPAPLNMRCNPFVTRDVDQFRESCDLARLGVAVWVAKPEAFHAFDDWMFQVEPGRLFRGRTLEAAMAQATELVGKEKLAAALTSPTVDAYLRTSMDLYGKTIYNGNAVPKFVLGTRWITPEPRDVDDLIAIFHSGLSLPLPQKK